MKNVKYLIIGNSVSGINAIESIRQHDKNNSITIISNEPYHTYSRPLISYLLAGTVKENRMSYRDKDFYELNKVETIFGKEVKKVDVNEKTVQVEKEQKISFEKLLISTGGTPIVPKMKGLGLKGVFTFTTLDDAKKIKKYIEDNKIKNAVVIGGGLIGLKATEGLLENKINVTIVELADRILSATFDKTASSIIESALNKVGCNLVTNNTVVEITGKNSKVNAVKLKNKKTIKTEMVILAIGVTPNTALLKDSGIIINRGITVNKYMQTNNPDIYAAGDVVESFDSINNINRVIAIWPFASKQGKIAGRNMASEVLKDASLKKEYEGGFPMNSVELCHIPTISVGLTDPKEKDYEILETLDQKNSTYKKIVLKNNLIVGTIFIGKIENAGVYTGLINDKADVSSFKEHLLKDNFGLISLPKEYRKHLVTGSGIEV